MVHSFVNTVSVGHCPTCAESSSARPPEVGTAVCDVFVFSGWAGYCTAGDTIPRMKSTPETRRPEASATRRPAKAPSRIDARTCAGMAS